MKFIYAILSMLSLTLVACSDGPAGHADSDEPIKFGFHAADAPISRAETALDGNHYTVITGCLFRTVVGPPFCWYLNYDDVSEFDAEMQYGESDGYRYFFLEAFFPVAGDIDIFAYGYPKSVPAEKRIPRAKYLPKVEDLENESHIESVKIDLTKEYDGTYELIVADPQVFQCFREIQLPTMPIILFRHVQANLRFNLTIPNDANVRDRVTINSIRIENAPHKGVYTMRPYTGYTRPAVTPSNHVLFTSRADAGTWTDTKGETTVTNLKKHYFDSNNLITAGEGAYIVPQTRKRIIVNYTLANGAATEGSFDNANKRQMNFVIDPGDDEVWEPGHQYIYNICLNNACQMSVTGITVLNYGHGDTGNMVIQ